MNAGRSNFDLVKDRIKQRWRRLSEEEIEELETRSDILVLRLQEHYGWDREEAERQVREFRNRHGWH